MNPNSTLRPWILACGRQFGIRSAHDYRYPDYDTRNREMFCTYKLVSEAPMQKGVLDLTGTTENTVNRSGSQAHRVTVQLDLYNSQDGMYELSAFGVAANKCQAIRKIFRDHGCSFLEVVKVDNASTFDDDIVNYHHVMTCTFEEMVEISLDEVNGVVKEIDLTLDLSGDYQTRQIFIDGIEPTAGDLVATGTVTLTVT